jgi:hypothetical protein
MVVPTAAAADVMDAAVTPELAPPAAIVIPGILVDVRGVAETPLLVAGRNVLSTAPPVSAPSPVFPVAEVESAPVPPTADTADTVNPVVVFRFGVK